MLQRYKYLISVLLGSLSVFGFAPFYYYPIPILVLAGAFHLWKNAKSNHEAALLGLLFGLGFFCTGIYWIYISLHDFGGMPFWMAGFATFCLCGFLAIFPMTVAYFSKRSGSLLICAPLFWAFSDWVRSWIFTGFPWLSIGYSQVPFSPLANYAPVFGIYGVSLVTALSSTLLLLIMNQSTRKKSIFAISLLWLSGSLLGQVDWSKPSGGPIRVALLQGNVSQDIKWDKDVTLKTIDLYYSMISQSLSFRTPPQLIILPETALPVFIESNPEEQLQPFTQLAKAHDINLLIGAVEVNNNSYYNSMINIGKDESQYYRKSHLVPFGEFIPLKSVFGWIYRDWLNMPLSDLSRGGIKQRPMSINGQKIALNICYEDVFGEEIIRQLPEASILINASNDAWYGNSVASYQHLQISQARAMETSRMLLRSTNTGATAIIDKNGQIISHAPHFKTMTLFGQAQGYVGVTPYMIWGNDAFLLTIFLGFLFICLQNKNTFMKIKIPQSLIWN